MPRATQLLRHLRHRPPPAPPPRRPPTRPRSQPGPHRGYPRVLLRKRPHPAPRIRTTPPAFGPLQKRRPAETGLIHQPRPPPTLTQHPAPAPSAPRPPHHLNTHQPHRVGRSRTHRQSAPHTGRTDHPSTVVTRNASLPAPSSATSKTRTSLNRTPTSNIRGIFESVTFTTTVSASPAQKTKHPTSATNRE